MRARPGQGELPFRCLPLPVPALPPAPPLPAAPAPGPATCPGPSQRRPARGQRLVNNQARHHVFVEKLRPCTDRVSAFLAPRHEFKKPSPLSRLRCLLFPPATLSSLFCLSGISISHPSTSTETKTTTLDILLFRANSPRHLSSPSPLDQVRIFSLLPVPPHQPVGWSVLPGFLWHQLTPPGQNLPCLGILGQGDSSFCLAEMCLLPDIPHFGICPLGQQCVQATQFRRASYLAPWVRMALRVCLTDLICRRRKHQTSWMEC